MYLKTITAISHILGFVVNGFFNPSKYKCKIITIVDKKVKYQKSWMKRHILDLHFVVNIKMPLIVRKPRLKVYSSADEKVGLFLGITLQQV